MKQAILFLISTFLWMSCKDNTLPKPPAYLSLQYEKPSYVNYRAVDCPYSFDINQTAQITPNSACGLTLAYPNQQAEVFLTYKEVNQNLDNLLRDAQNLTQKHVVKAESITEQPFINAQKQVFGMLYEVTGNAASQTQFYLTDSLHHFVTGAVYFRAKPSYDSLLPASQYLKDDIVRLIESFNWVN